MDTVWEERPDYERISPGRIRSEGTSTKKLTQSLYQSISCLPASLSRQTGQAGKVDSKKRISKKQRSKSEALNFNKTTLH